MPYFIARLTQSGRTVVVDRTGLVTRAEAEAMARQRYPAESPLIIEARDPGQAAIEASIALDSRRPNLVIAEQLVDTPEEGSPTRSD